MSVDIFPVSCSIALPQKTTCSQGTTDAFAFGSQQYSFKLVETSIKRKLRDYTVGSWLYPRLEGMELKWLKVLNRFFYPLEGTYCGKNLFPLRPPIPPTVLCGHYHGP